MDRFWLATLSLFLLSLSTGCGQSKNDHYQGYVEGEYQQIAAPLAGQLETLSVRRGMRVAAGDPLFILEHVLESAGVAEAEQGVARATSQLTDLTKGKRPSELKALESHLAQAEAAQVLAQKEFDRLEKLVREQSVSQEAHDRAASELVRTAALVDELTANLETAKLGARIDVLETARVEVRAAGERLLQARWKQDQKSRTAPQSGLVFDTYYTPGEFVPAGYPVLSLLSPGQIKIRFFVPETVVGTLQVGHHLTFTFDGAGKNYDATITYISPQAEYTPPVIYSREARSKLVFMLEARPDPAVALDLHPGQPVDVRLEPRS
ncbi:MAG: HlyD family efflux transporter periplasmic adaptor subunit [Proteobacteria bacterium]|nr:HlyD family efflux transporter periplasmic adaptor subunit [Pseudomonadota bacterium]MBU1687369.1 HlyD family efflux transporter periplasmic adaptor subunit [Pseudomonadota bacterium]